MLHPYKSILCLDGDLPSANFLQSMQLPIIAADGAANALVAMGIYPEWVIGDLDSIDPVLLTKINTLHRPDQNYSDYEKSLAYMQENNLLPAIICGTNGGHLDHILNNINLFIQANNLILSEKMLGFMLRAPKIQTISLPMHSKISIFGAPTALVSSKGLRWELTEYAMNFFGKNSCFNQSILPNVSLQILQGNSLILLHLLKELTLQDITALFSGH